MDFRRCDYLHSYNTVAFCRFNHNWGFDNYCNDAVKSGGIDYCMEESKEVVGQEIMVNLGNTILLNLYL